MAKVKEKLYENRFGLFFFGVLIGYCFIANSMHWGQITEISYANHIVDFSVGFCTKLLPGAVCNFLLGEVTRENLQIFLSILIVLCFMLVAILLEKLVLSQKKESRIYLIIISMFFLTGIFTFFFHFESLVWFDFYWLFFSVLSFFALMKKETYILVIPFMLAAIMSHYGAIICYVPFIAIVMLYKISQTTEKKEKMYLWIVWLVLVISALGLSVYMITTEAENVKMSFDEFNQFFLSKGVSEDCLEPYQVYFFRDKVIEMREAEYPVRYEEFVNKIKHFEKVLPELLYVLFFQIYSTFLLAKTETVIPYLLLLVPLIAVIYATFIFDYKTDKSNKLKRFSLLCIMVLFFFTLIGGRILSIDTVRWISNALIPVLAFFFYTVYKGNVEYKEKVKEMFAKLPALSIGIYYFIYAFMVR